MNKLEAYEHLFDDVIKPFETTTTHKPIEGQLIYISTADIYDNPFIKMTKEYLEENQLLEKENKNDT